MQIALGVLAGLVWGALAGFLNTRITKRAIEKNSNNALMVGNLLRTVVDLLALTLVYLLRGVLPLRYEPVLVGTAIGLSLVTVVFAYRYGKSKK